MLSEEFNPQNIRFGFIDNIVFKLINLAQLLKYSNKQYPNLIGCQNLTDIRSIAGLNQGKALSQITAHVF